MAQIGLFGQFKPKIFGIKVGIDINLIRVNIPVNGREYLDQGFGIGYSAFGREGWFGFERSGYGSLANSSFAPYGDVDSLGASSDGLTVGVEMGVLSGFEVQMTHAEALLPTGDTRCQQ